MPVGALHRARSGHLRGHGLLGLVALLAVACSSGPEPATLSAPGLTTTSQATTTSVVTTTTIQSELLDLIEGVGMTPEARAIFLATDPRIEDTATFARGCDELSDTADEMTHTHGCFAKGKIHMRAVGSPEIADLIYVVAAHELLHAVYVRLPASERATVDAQLEAVRRNAAPLRERLGAYAADAIAAEAHSIAGTELATLPKALDDHYDRYIDRDKVTAAYEKALGARDREIRRLRVLVADLDAQIEEERSRLDALEAAQDIDGFNAAVGPFNDLVSERNRQAANLNSRIRSFNRLISA